MTIPLSNLTDTWNDGGTAFTAIKINVTNTASAAASLLLDLQVGAVSKFNVSKDGDVTLVPVRALNWDTNLIGLVGSSKTVSLDGNSQTATPTLEIFEAGRVGALFGDRWRNTRHGLTMWNSLENERSIVITANNFNTPYIVATKTRNTTENLLHGPLQNGDRVFLLDVYGSNVTSTGFSWDGCGRISLDIDGPTGEGGGMPNAGFPTAWSILATSPGFVGYTDRLIMPSNGAARHAYWTCDPAYEDVVTYMMEYRLSFIGGSTITPVPVAGVGIGIKFTIVQDEFVPVYLAMGTTEFIATDLTAASEDFDFVLKCTAGGSLTELMRVSKSGTATHTALLLYDTDNNTVERVTVGAADSGGAGFKVLRIPN